MQLWMTWLSWVWQLRSAFSRQRTFLWAIVILASFSVRPDLAGVSSFIRGHWLSGRFYRRLLHQFHSDGVNLIKLSEMWVALCFKLFEKTIVKVGGRAVILADGIKNPKEGRKMPGVKLLHQESTNNSKPEYIMAHSCQAISLLIGSVGSFFAVPLASRIHEGIVVSNRDRRTLLDKMIILLESLSLPMPYYLIADAYYACRKIALPLIAGGNHLVSRVRTNAIAYLPIEASTKIKKRGRPKIYGSKIKLKSFFKRLDLFVKGQSPIYGEAGITIQYYCQDLIWRQLWKTVRYVWVIHPTRGSIILVTTDCSLEPLRVIELYGLRFKIEVSFKQALHLIGAYSYRFWMKAMDKIKRGTGDQYLHHKSEKYREQVKRKIRAYELHIQFGLIAQGMLQYLSVTFPKEIWFKFGSWLRTMNSDACPSEQVTAMALRHSFPEYLFQLPDGHSLKKFLADKLDYSRCSYFRLTG